MEIRPGTVVDRYAVLGPLGSGGMASVWRVRHRVLGSLHALKVLHITAPVLRERLIREGRIQAGLRHPNLVPVTDVVDVGDAPGLVMDLVRGPSLDRVLAERRLLPVEADALAQGILEGVAFAHAHGLVHRDLKPGNVLLDAAGVALVPRVTDFGVARLNEPEPSSTRTCTGMALGTPAYMAPEQVLDARSADARADVWSLGTILYELLSGFPTFPGQVAMEVMADVVAGRFWSLEERAVDVSPARCAVVRHALAMDRAARPADACALLAAWEEAGGAPLQRGWDADLREIAVRLAPEPEPVPPVDGTRTITSTAAHRDAPPMTSPPSPRTNLPPEPDAFVGRQEELEAVGSMFAGETRLVALLGPGGAGKSRLGRRYGALHLLEYPGGAWLCDLTDAGSLHEVCQSVARSLGFALTERDPVGHVGRELACREPLLLILDNVESVVEFAPATIGAWTEAVPRGQFLVTSRERLRLPGEQIVEIGPLALAAGVKLFHERAAAARRSAGAADESVVQDIVRRLECMPLCIELAAARTTVLSAKQIRDRIDQRFRLLGAGGRGVPARHATLRGALDWSWDLLPPWEADALGQCSVFRGGFFLEAAEAVVDLSRYAEAGDVLDVVQALVDKSLLFSRSVPALDGERRIGMYESIREYAWEKLTASGDPHGVQARHATWYAAHGERLAEGVHGPSGPARIERLDLEAENLRVAHIRLEKRHPVVAERAARAAESVAVLPGSGVVSLPRFDALVAASSGLHPGLQSGLLTARGWAREMSGQLAEAEEDLVLARALAQDAGDARAEGRALRALGRVYRHVKPRAEVEGVIAAAIECSERAGDRRNVVTCRLDGVWYRVFRAPGAYDRAEIASCLEEFQALGDRFGEERCLEALGMMELRLGRREQALEFLQQGLSIRAEIGYHWRRSIGRIHIGLVHMDAGELDEAEACFRWSAAYARESGRRIDEATARVNLGHLHRLRGSPSGAEPHLRRALALFGSGWQPRSQGYAWALLGAVHADRGESPEAERAFDGARTNFQATEDGSGLHALAVLEGHLDLARARAARESGDPDSAAKHLQAGAARAAAARAPGPDGSTSRSDGSHDVRLALLVLERDLRAFREQVPTRRP